MEVFSLVMAIVVCGKAIQLDNKIVKRITAFSGGLNPGF